MSRGLYVTLVVLSAWLASTESARAETRVRVVETYPAETELTLARNQRFYLRLAYETDAPVKIWAQPHYGGKPANAGSHGSRTYAGSGEALGWFFLMQPGDRVDEIRIVAGSGGRNSTPLVATHRVRIVGGTGAAAVDAPPPWVASLRALDEAARQAEAAARAAEPTSVGWSLLVSILGLGALALGIAGIVGPVVAARRWRGGWRLAALAPAVLMGLVLLNILVGTLVDSSSHNLWPFELLMAAG